LALALEESVQDEDQLQEWDGVTFVYDSKVAPHLEDKTIDFQDGPQSGFMIKREGHAGPDCGSCC